MPRPKIEQVMRHESDAEDEDSFLGTKDSGFVPVAVRPRKKIGKGKRSVEDMLASMPNNAAKVVYALERVAALEDQIAKILALCPAEARVEVLKTRPSLRKYAPEE